MLKEQDLRLFLSTSVARQARRRSRRLAATATTAREQKKRSQERPRRPGAAAAGQSDRARDRRARGDHGALRRGGAPAPRLRRRRAALPEAAAAHVREKGYGAARRDADLSPNIMFAMFILRHAWYVVHRRSHCVRDHVTFGPFF